MITARGTFQCLLTNDTMGNDFINENEVDRLAVPAGLGRGGGGLRIGLRFRAPGSTAAPARTVTAPISRFAQLRWRLRQVNGGTGTAGTTPLSSSRTLWRQSARVAWVRGNVRCRERHRSPSQVGSRYRKSVVSCCHCGRRWAIIDPLFMVGNASALHF